MITPRFPLLQLIPNAVRAYIDEVEPTLGTTVAAGWKARARSINQGRGSGNRIAFVPKGPMQVGPPTDPGEKRPPLPGGEMVGRELASLRFRLVVYFWGYDPTDARTPAQTTDESGDTGDDMRHAARALHLFELTAQALARNAWGITGWGAGDFTDTGNKDLRHGVELWMPLEINVPICDRAPLYARPAAGSPNKGPEPGSDS